MEVISPIYRFDEKAESLWLGGDWWLVADDAVQYFPAKLIFRVWCEGKPALDRLRASLIHSCDGHLPDDIAKLAQQAMNCFACLSPAFDDVPPSRPVVSAAEACDVIPF